ncbi:glycogen synthase [Candidatus Nomurabacteria bacterium]|uniref:Glycogen synthase n=1 Tax=candidate division WWE3 bacterium TaxID=2053526 RepID=A0A955IWB8_UNCKA|nr:glycogen synthase [candidate division WWE3 bacterium]MCB9823616.1 glycogen synthase [Candidatus Nomurabacteria bacterium]MCB9827411.1 glycogen synthase [Candidatus Nomurabacteria bacterium]
MKVLFVTSEVAPIRKFGGLGDFSASLPKALSGLGVAVDIIFPYYAENKLENYVVTKLIELQVPYNNKSHTIPFYCIKLNSDLRVLMPKITHSNLPVDNYSDVEFFSFFNRCVVEYIKSQYNTYNVVHCNDWHAGFVTHILEQELGHDRPKTLLTIHNFGYQGVFDPVIVMEMGLTPGEHPLVDWDISDGDVNMLLQGIGSSDFVNTVSPSYASELMEQQEVADSPQIIQVLLGRKDRFKGILNGIDYTQLPRSFSAQDFKKHKSETKRMLQEKFKLDLKEQAPLFSFISRLDPGQKGLDILFESVKTIDAIEGQFILLGTGDKAWEKKFSDILSHNMSVNITFDVELANAIYSASDFFFVPSKYEPCGLTQMMAMWYGALPIVHNVGGLKDTVVDGKNGFVFDDYSSKALSEAIIRASEVYKNRPVLDEMIKSAMLADFSWKISALEYKRLYEDLVRGTI